VEIKTSEEIAAKLLDLYNPKLTANKHKYSNLLNVTLLLNP
jgi:hypothetical protein